MLKYKINLKQVSNDNVELIECHTLCLAQDGSFISGITSSDYGLVDGQKVFVNEDGTNYFDDYKISLKKVTIQGYVVVPQKYQIETYNNVYVGFKFIDGNIYVFENDNTLTLDSIYNDNEENALVYQGQTEILINTRYFVENGKVYINGEYYDVDFYEENPYIQIRNHTNKLLVYDIDGNEFNELSFNKTVDVVKFIINKKENYPITIDNISCTRKFMYIKYPSNSENSHKYYLEKNYSEDKWELKGFIYDDKIGKYKYDTISGSVELDYVYEYVKVNGEQYKIYNEWKNTTRGNKLHVYANSSDLTYSVGQTILVHKLNISPTARIDVNSYLDTNVKSVKYNGIIYYTPIDENTKETKKLTYVDYFGEKLLFNESLENWGIDNSISEEFPSADKYGFILVNDMPLLMYISENQARTMDDYGNNPSVSGIWTDTFEIIEYEYIEIDNIKHIIKNTSRYVEIDGELMELKNEYIELFDSSPIKLLIEDIHSGNQLRCSISSESYDNSDMMYMLSINYSDFLFELENEIFNSSATSIAPNSERGYAIPIYNIYKPIDNINVPILLSNYNGTNLHQEFVVDKMFFDVEEQKAINSPIDMEKDIYYPITIVTDGANSGITEVDEIIFDLHFRTRTIDDWKVVSDNNITFVDDGKEVSAVKCNYNILDYYDWAS